MGYNTHEPLVYYVLLVLCLRYLGTQGATDTEVPGTSSSQFPTVSDDPSDKLPDDDDCVYNFTGPSDDIFIIDRSASFSKNNFENAKDFVKDLIEKSFYIKEDWNHIAVFTFSSSATEAFDFISEGSGSIPPECELFLPGGLWENVAYDEINNHGENLQDALDFAWRAFQRSRQRSKDGSVSRRLWLMTDFHDISLDGVERFSEVDIYGYSAGQYSDHTKFYAAIGEDKVHCNYKNRTNWTAAKASFVTLDKSRPQRVLVPVTDTSLCGDRCSEGCSCDEFLPFKSLDELQCTAGGAQTSTNTVEDYEGMNLTIVIAASVSAVGLIVIIAIIVGVCLYCRMRRKKSQPTPIPSLTRPQGTSTDTMSTVCTDASTYTNSTLLQPGKMSTKSTATTTSNGSTATYAYERAVNINTVSQSIQHQEGGDNPLYVNGELGQILMEHGIAQDTMTKNKAKKQQEENRTQTPPVVLTTPAVHNKLYKKNPGAKAPEGYCGRHNNTGGAPSLGHNRNVSDLSDISTTPSYIVPIPDDVCSIGPYKYSYPYLHMSGRSYEAPVVPGTKTPTSTHSYEKFSFPFAAGADSQEEDNNNDAPGNSSSSEMTELEAKLSKFRQKCEDKAKPIKYTDFNDKYSSSPVGSPSLPGNAVSMRFPQRILPTNPGERQNEECPMYIDPEEKNLKHTSAKLGTLKFKNLFYMFSDVGKGKNETMSTHSPVDQSYSVPYSTHQGLPNKENPIAQPFREIM